MLKYHKGNLKPNLHIKPTNRHQYLHYSSSHPGHTNQSLTQQTTEMKSWLHKRGYPNDVIQKEMEKVKFSKISSTRKDNTNGVPLVVTYHPGLKNIDQKINKNSCLLYMDQEVKEVFTPKPVVSFCSTRKPSSYLVRAKLYPLDRKVGSFKCRGKRCQTSLNVN